jgi:hypothetical protein
LISFSTQKFFASQVLALGWRYLRGVHGPLIVNCLAFSQVLTLDRRDGTKVLVDVRDWLANDTAM